MFTRYLPFCKNAYSSILLSSLRYLNNIALLHPLLTVWHEIEASSLYRYGKTTYAENGWSRLNHQAAPCHAILAGYYLLLGKLDTESSLDIQ